MREPSWPSVVDRIPSPPLLTPVCIVPTTTGVSGTQSQRNTGASAVLAHPSSCNTVGSVGTICAGAVHLSPCTQSFRLLRTLTPPFTLGVTPGFPSSGVPPCVGPTPCPSVALGGPPCVGPSPCPSVDSTPSIASPSMMDAGSVCGLPVAALLGPTHAAFAPLFPSSCGNEGSSGSGLLVAALVGPTHAALVPLFPSS